MIEHYVVRLEDGSKYYIEREDDKWMVCKDGRWRKIVTFGITDVRKITNMDQIAGIIVLTGQRAFGKPIVTVVKLGARDSLVDVKGKTFYAKTKSGTEYRLEKKNSEWYIFFEGTLRLITSFGKLEPESVIFKEQILHRIIWFESIGGHTGNTSEIVNVFEEKSYFFGLIKKKLEVAAK